MKQALFFICITSLCLSLFGQKNPKPAKNYLAGDTASHVTGPLPYDYSSRMVYKKLNSSSMYLQMRDSVLIAVNVTLPKGLSEGEKIPAIVYQTRYWRGAKFRFPFSLFVNNFSTAQGKMIKEVIRNGYAFIAVDARGSGASMGSRKHPWSEDEVQDGAEIVDWVITQSWSNGNVGAAGVSYSGTTAEFLATTLHPAVKAVAPMFSLYDVYDDISLPGGVQLEYFTKNWGEANYKLDNNKLPIKKFPLRLIVKGVQPVKGQKKMVKEAVLQHQANLSVNDGVQSIIFRDDTSKMDGQTATDNFSPHTFSHLIDQAGVAVYSISGWFDGDYQHAAVKRFLTLQNPSNKLLLGPWEHGGTLNCSRFNPGKSGFNMAGELLKFFDFHLKGLPTGIDKEPRIHYFTMGAEKWQSENFWSPQNTQYRTYYFNDNGNLSLTNPKSSDAQSSIISDNHANERIGYTDYKVDSTFGTGEYSRWRSLLGQLKIPFPYHDWHEKSKELPHFTTTPLENEIEMTGHPILNLYLTSTNPDAAFHVYLQDVDENGKAHYVTEGVFRALHRKVSQETHFYTDAENVPFHSFLKKDEMSLKPGEVENITLDLFPVSYLFKKGHAIRISIAGADADHFKAIYPEAHWKIHHSGEYNSHLALPVAE